MPDTQYPIPNTQHPTIPNTRTWVEIHLDALAANVTNLQNRMGATDAVMAVVKANGYGHGAVPVARTCVRLGTRYFAVASVAEAVALRNAGIAEDIFTLSPFLPDEAEVAVRNDVIPFVSGPEQFAALVEVAKAAPLPVRAFLIVDTGMGREGCSPAEALALWELAKSTRLRFTGIATHFSSADEPDGDIPTERQIAILLRFLADVGSEVLTKTEDGRGNRGVWLSLSNSPATVRFRLPVVPVGVRGYLYRAGLLLYGIEPYRGAFAGTTFSPVLSWYARVTLIKELPTGATIGYGRTHTLSRPSRIATLAVGYGDGLSRYLSNRGTVLIRRQRFPIVGRVSMDQCQVDVTDAHETITPGDMATLIGQNGEEMQSVLDLAECEGTTPHAIPCALTSRVPRIVAPSALFAR